MVVGGLRWMMVGGLRRLVVTSEARNPSVVRPLPLLTHPRDRLCPLPQQRLIRPLHEPPHP
jgi:hypothetical protein